MTLRLLISTLVLAASAPAQSALPAPPPGNVTMTLDEYNRLVELAAKPPRKPDAPPVPYVLRSAQIDLQVGAESVSGVVVLEGEVLARGDRKVPLVSGMTVLDAQQKSAQGSAVLPLQQESGVHSALLPGPSEFAVTLETGLPLSIETGRASFTLPVPAAGAARLRLTVPGDHTQVNLSPGLITSRSSAGGRTTIEATLASGQSANLWWAARLSAPLPPAAPKEERFLSDVKTLVTVREAELAVVALAEITVVQGEPAQFRIQAPEGFELTGATGPTLLSSDSQPGALVLRVADPAARAHQFLISLARPNTNPRIEVPLIAFNGSGRETGEALVEAEGAIELTAAERGGLRRMDLKESSPYLRSLARAPVHAAFRYQRKAAEKPALALQWVRFPDGSVLTAVAQQAVVTTLVTTEGRLLTEVKLTLKNHAQPCLKVALPTGASILSADVAGEKVKPVQGADGSRVPLLRPGFRPAGAYAISFVFQHAGAPFGKKGDAELALPKMDIPIGLLKWEVFLPQQYKVSDFTGDALAARLLPASGEDESEDVEYTSTPVATVPLGPGEIGGIVTDPADAIIPKVQVTVLHLPTGLTLKAFTDRYGRWRVSNVPSGRVRVTGSALGFRSTTREFHHDAARGSPFSFALQVGEVTESVTVNAETSSVSQESRQVERNARQAAAAAELAASANVLDFQRRVAGVLPIAVNVPRTGSSYRFVRPLVLDEETRLTFHYRVR